MALQITSFVLGAAAGAIVTVSFAFPRVGRIATRILAVLGIAAGAGLLAWGFRALFGGDSLRAIEVQSVVISQPSEALGWSAGLLAGGITALVLSFLGGSHR